MLIELPPWATNLNIDKMGKVSLSGEHNSIQLGKIRTTAFFKPSKGSQYYSMKLIPIQDNITRFLDEQMRVVADFDKPYKQYVLEKLLSKGD